MEADADRAATLAAAKGQIARYRYQPPPGLSDQCFDLKAIVRTLRTARETAEQSKWQKQMAAVCAKAGKTIEL
jgi:hypothetical protein